MAGWTKGGRRAPHGQDRAKKTQHFAGELPTQQKDKNGDEYEPGTLAGTFSSIKRFLEQSSYPVPLLGTEDFKMAREVLASKKKDLKAKGKGNRPNKVSIFFFLIEREKQN